MKAKLIKHDFGYNLVDTNGKHIATSKDKYSNGINQDYWLSVKNCQAIENGYDLDELVLEFIGEDDGHPSTTDHSYCFKEGFKKAIEILGDKKYDMNDIALAFRAGIEHGLNPKKPNTTEYVQSIQQTEWDVEIVTEPMNLDEIREQGKGFLNSNTNKPKLDPDGCLILKGI